MNRSKIWLNLALAAALFPSASRGAEGAATARSTANLDLARQLNQAFVQVAEDVSPAVVVITVTQKAASAFKTPPGDGTDEEQQDPMEQFRRFLGQRPTTGQGSGIIIRRDGYILTNHHVVENADDITVRLKDGRTFKGTVRGMDAPSDVAVIKIDASDLPAAKLADSSKTRVGEFAIAIGAPFALDYSVTFGHVSAKDRSNIVPDDAETTAGMTDQSFIQTDANINPGNSGGPLINIEGEVIGVNTLIRGLHTGIGFAIPSNLAKEVSDKLISDGKFSRSWLGVRIKSLREDTDFRDLVPGVKDGVVVREIIADGPAAKSDLQPADVITAVDGRPVVTSQQLKDEIRAKKVGQDVTLDVFREARDGGKQIKIMVKPGEWGGVTLTTAIAETNTKDDSTEGNLGIKVGPVRSRGQGARGVLVTRVDPTSVAARLVKEGDIIISVNQQSVNNPQQYRDATRDVDTKKGVMLNLISQGTARFEILKQAGD